MDSRLIFLRRLEIVQYIREGVMNAGGPLIVSVAARLNAFVVMQQVLLPRKADCMRFPGDRTKSDTGRQGEYPQVLEIALVKELGKLAP